MTSTFISRTFCLMLETMSVRRVVPFFAFGLFLFVLAEIAFKPQSLSSPHRLSFEAGLYSMFQDFIKKFSPGGSSGNVHSSGTQQHKSYKPNEDKDLFTHGDVNALSPSESREIRAFNTCWKVSHHNLPPSSENTKGITDNDKTSFIGQLHSRVGNNPNANVSGKMNPATQNLQLFVPHTSQAEWDCFLGGKPPGVSLVDCSAPPPTTGESNRFRCAGGGCWNRTATCPGGATPTAIRATMNAEHVDNLEGALNSMAWGKAYLEGAQWGDRGDSARKGGKNPPFFTAIINGIGIKPYPVENIKIVDIPITGPTVTWGCRDEDSTNSGECTMYIDLECPSQTQPRPTPPGAQGKNCMNGI